MARAPSVVGKTRLAPHLSAVRLRALRAALLADTLDVIGAARAEGVDPVLFFTPASAAPEIGALTIHPFDGVRQTDGDLGQRMRSALEELLEARAYGAAMLVGADIPFLSATHLLEARETLRASGGVVLGPADDGGYYLIGMGKVHRGLFERIEWGTGSVLTDTLRAAERLGLEARLIAGTYDIDTIDDLQRLECDLASTAAAVAPRVRQWFLGGESAWS
jgi:rSAM/selenodomain-associated transferase 1